MNKQKTVSQRPLPKSFVIARLDSARVLARSQKPETTTGTVTTSGTTCQGQFAA